MSHDNTLDYDRLPFEPGRTRYTYRQMKTEVLSYADSLPAAEPADDYRSRFADAWLSVLQDAATDSAAPGFCFHCGNVQDAEPDATANYCDNCEEPRVRSILVIEGLI